MGYIIEIDMTSIKLLRSRYKGLKEKSIHIRIRNILNRIVLMPFDE